MGSENSKQQRKQRSQQQQQSTPITYSEPTNSNDFMIVQSIPINFEKNVRQQVAIPTPPPSYSEVQQQFQQIPQGQPQYVQQQNAAFVPIAMGNYPHVTAIPSPSQYQPHYTNNPVVMQPTSPMIYPQQSYQPTAINPQPLQKSQADQKPKNQSKPEQKASKNEQKSINLNLDDLTAITNRIKGDKNSSFIELNKHIGKNKPLSETRKSLVNNKYLSDARFIIDNQIIYAHKLFIATTSVKFFKHFHVDGNEEMKVDGIDYGTLIEVLNYCYTGQLKISEDNVLSLCLAADVLEIKQITNICHSFVNSKMNPDTIFVIFEEAIKHDFSELQKKCLDFITKNEEKCFNSKGFYEIALNSLLMVLNACKYSTERSNQLVEKWTEGIHSEEPKKEEVVAKNPSTGAVKKSRQRNAAKKAPQNLIDVPIPTHPPEFANFYKNVNPTRPFALASTSSIENLINFDDDDDISGVICKDESDDDLTSEMGDAKESRTPLVISGTTQKITTEFSRIDLSCKKSISIYEIWFNENLFASDSNKSIRVTISLCDGEKKANIHTRVVKNGAKPGWKFNFIKFYKKPLKIQAGKNFFIKLNFSEATTRTHYRPTKISPPDFLEVRAQKKSYFNCISKIVVTENS